MFVAASCAGKMRYHLAVWPSSHAARRTECECHPAAPAEALVFARLEDETVPSLLKNILSYIHIQTSQLCILFFRKSTLLKLVIIYLLKQYALRNLPKYTNHIKNCAYKLLPFHIIYRNKINWIRVAISCLI